jgi:hypothetical protein
MATGLQDAWHASRQASTFGSSVRQVGGPARGNTCRADQADP